MGGDSLKNAIILKEAERELEEYEEDPFLYRRSHGIDYDDTVYVGEIKSPEVDFEEEEIQLTKGNVLGAHHFPQRNWESKDPSLPVLNFLPQHYKHRREGITKELFFGPKEVEGYILSPDPSYRTHKPKASLRYIVGLERIGHEPSQELKEVKIDAQAEVAQGLVKDIVSLIQSTREEEEEIRKIYQSRKHGGFVQGGALTIVEDKDDAAVVSGGNRRKIERNREKMERKLKEAKSLDLHNFKGEVSLGLPAVYARPDELFSGLYKDFGLD